jgi:hypothetical protein
MEEATKSEAEKLEEPIADTKKYLPSCIFDRERIMHISLVLDRADKEVRVNDNLSVQEHYLKA